MNYAEKTRSYEPYFAFMTRRLCMKEYQPAINIYYSEVLKMEQGKKRRVYDVLKWPTKKRASTQIEIDPQAIVVAPAVLFPKHG